MCSRPTARFVLRFGRRGCLEVAQPLLRQRVPIRAPLWVVGGWQVKSWLPAGEPTVLGGVPLVIVRVVIGNRRRTRCERSSQLLGGQARRHDWRGELKTPRPGEPYTKLSSPVVPAASTPGFSFSPSRFSGPPNGEGKAFSSPSPHPVGPRASPPRRRRFFGRSVAAPGRLGRAEGRIDGLHPPGANAAESVSQEVTRSLASTAARRPATRPLGCWSGRTVFGDAQWFSRPNRVCFACRRAHKATHARFVTKRLPRVRMRMC